ncbi:MAG: STAS domain-containing protein [Gammaproteobacteria bacterium]|nr:STAS domain-containing protein [Gammaproteobacteria bacterium]MBU1655316.1 STAS domain-containing protein [Gammaproteobacteria bacterium]MBU1961461.1 STAS domain-containing protein [Gammaproteobacteria bacterium]
MSRTLELGPLLTIAEGAQTLSSLEGVLRGSQSVTIDAARVTAVDTAGLQLLAVFCREAESRGIPVHWQSVGKTIAKAAGLLGLTEALGLPPAGQGD